MSDEVLVAWTALWIVIGEAAWKAWVERRELSIRLRTHGGFRRGSGRFG